MAESASFHYGDPKCVAAQCAKAYEMLGIKPSKKNWVRVGGVIVDGSPARVQP